MTPVKLRKKNVVLFVLFTSFIYLICYSIGIHPVEFIWDIFFFDQSYTRCNNNLRWKEKLNSKHIGKLAVLLFVFPTKIIV